MKAEKPERHSHAPGNFYYYNNWDFNALGTIFELETGERIFQAFNLRVAKPLQMQDFEIGDLNYFGGPESIHPAYPFRITARDLARFGLLLLRNGRWNEKQIIPESWVEESTRTHTQTDRLIEGGGYGYMWWTGEGESLFPNVKVHGHCFFAAGYGGHYVIVLPYADLVVVHRVDTDLPDRRVDLDQMGYLLRLILSAAGQEDLGPLTDADLDLRDFGNVPLPQRLRVTPPPAALPGPLKALSGRWAGTLERIAIMYWSSKKCSRTSVWSYLLSAVTAQPIRPKGFGRGYLQAMVKTAHWS